MGETIEVTLIGGEPEDDPETVEVPKEVNGWVYAPDAFAPGIVWHPEGKEGQESADAKVSASKSGGHSYLAKVRTDEADRNLSSRSMEAAVNDALLLARNNDPPSCGCDHSGQTTLSGGCYDPTEEFDR